MEKIIKWSTPKISLPEPLRGSEDNTFVGHTVRERMKKIGLTMMEEAFFDDSTNERLQALMDSLPFGEIEPINDSFAPDNETWSQYIQPYLGQTWLDIPWFFAETYFYRRIIEVTGFYQSCDNYLVDPFSSPKTKGLIDSFPVFDELIKLFDQDLSKEEILRALLVLNLWGNKADLSFFPSINTGEEITLDPEQMESKIVVNHLNDLMKFFTTKKLDRIDIVLDNIGIELIADIVLTYWLIKEDFAKQVVLHHKIHPTFVSDATVKDTRELVYQLGKKDQRANQFIVELFDFVEDERIILMDHEYWTSPLPLWEMPESLQNYFLETDLLITKGDANYRRVLGDLHWAYDTNPSDVLSYSPVPLLTIRIAKSEVMVGLKQGQYKALFSIDEKWLYNGQWGVMMFHQPK